MNLPTEKQMKLKPSNKMMKIFLKKFRNGVRVSGMTKILLICIRRIFVDAGNCLNDDDDLLKD